MGFQDFLSTTDGCAPEFAHPRSFQHEVSPPLRHADRLPSLSVLMQPHAPFAHGGGSESYSQTSRAPPSSLPSLQVPQHQHQHQHQHQSTSSYYSQPPAASQHMQQQQPLTPYFAPPSPPNTHSWSPASATSSVDSSGDVPFPIRRQTFITHERSPSPDSPTDYHYQHNHHHQQQQQQQQRPSPCSCGCDPVSPDDEAALLAAAQFRAPTSACTVTRDPKTALAPATNTSTSTSSSSINTRSINSVPMTIASSSSSSSNDTEAATAAATATANGKTSRYLREMDRRAILARLDKGEKQSVLAKEYHVSRSSICNLFKHRDEVLSRVNQNPFTKHPKRPRAPPAAATTASSTANSNSTGLATKATEKLITCVKAIYSPFAPTSGCSAMPGAGSRRLETDMMVDTTGRVHRVSSRAAAVLLSILDKPALTEPEFHRCANQIMLVLLEEALVMLPALAACGAVSRLSPRPLCAITLEQANQHAMLDVFHSLEPHCPRGYVQFERSQWHQDVKVKLLDTQLAAPLRSHNVLLLDVAVTSPPLLAVVVESLLRNGAVEAQITVVAVFVARQVVELVQSKYPAVRIIATDIESGGCALAAPEQFGALGALAPPRSVLFKHRLDHMYATRSMDGMMLM